MLHALRATRPMQQMVVLAMVACALLMRVVVPQGWMPVRTTDGWSLTICNGAGPIAIGEHAMHHGQHDKQDHNAADHPCAFAGAALALDLVPPLAPDIVRDLAPIWTAGIARAVSIGRGLAAPPPPSTGPPAFS